MPEKDLAQQAHCDSITHRLSWQSKQLSLSRQTTARKGLCRHSLAWKKQENVLFKGKKNTRNPTLFLNKQSLVSFFESFPNNSGGYCFENGPQREVFRTEGFCKKIREMLYLKIFICKCKSVKALILCFIACECASHGIHKWFIIDFVLRDQLYR